MHVFFSSLLGGPSEDTEPIEILRFYSEARDHRRGLAHPSTLRWISIFGTHHLRRDYYLIATPGIVPLPGKVKAHSQLYHALSMDQ